MSHFEDLACGVEAVVVDCVVTHFDFVALGRVVLNLLNRIDEVVVGKGLYGSLRQKVVDNRLRKDSIVGSVDACALPFESKSMSVPSANSIS